MIFIMINDIHSAHHNITQLGAEDPASEPPEALPGHDAPGAGGGGRGPHGGLRLGALRGLRAVGLPLRSCN